MKSAQTLGCQFPEPVSDIVDTATSRRAMMDRLNAEHRTLNAGYPAGAWPWAKRARPDLTLAVEDAAGNIDTAILTGDAAGFQRALRLYSKRWTAVFDVYRAETAAGG